MNTSRHPARATIRSRTVGIGLGVAVGVGAIVLGSIVLLGGVGGRGAGSGVGVIPPASPIASAPGATPAPSVTPAPVPAPTATADGGDAMPIRVDLESATGADVYVDIVDQTGLLIGAASGTPGDGASVEAYAVKIENIDPKTLKLSWTDYPIDNALALYIDRFEGGYRFVLVQPEPTGPTDAIGFDRELTLTFAEPVSASQVEAFLQGGLDTPG